MQQLLAGLAVAGSFALGVAGTPAAPHGTRVLTFDDPAIVEASDLVVTDGLFVTTNDSGDTGQVFVVDLDGPDGRAHPLVERTDRRRGARPGRARRGLGRRHR